jgi:tRNA A-37 threonylcarbamoyl transferase component Bud32
LIFMKKAVAISQNLKSKIKESINLAPWLVRRPKIFLYWLLGARWAQLVLLLVILGMPKFIPAVVDPLMEKIYPPIVKKEIFGLINVPRPNPSLENSQEIARVVLWTGSGALVLFLLMLHIPQAVSKTTAMAQKRESEADALSDSQPSSSVMLYNSALSLASDTIHENSISNKIKRIDKRISKENYLKNSESKVSEGAETIRLESGSQTSFYLQRDEAKKSSYDFGEDGLGYNQRFLIQHELGQGAMGIVYRAHDRILDRDVALKQLSSHFNKDKDVISRFKQEAKALARLSHPNIVQVYDFFQEGGQGFIAMELVEGEDLADYLHDKGVLPISETVQLATQMAEALSYAHKHGVIHRDFKPANVILSMEGAAKITDFGLAKIAQSSIHTQLGSLLGSPAYMSPEQAQGKVADASSDIYALGVALYGMLSGRLPFTGDLESVIAQKLSGIPKPLSALDGEIPEQLNRLVFQMLEKEPDNRPESMDKVVEALKSIPDKLVVESENSI